MPSLVRLNTQYDPDMTNEIFVIPIYFKKKNGLGMTIVRVVMPSFNKQNRKLYINTLIFDFFLK